MVMHFDSPGFIQAVNTIAIVSKSKGHKEELSSSFFENISRNLYLKRNRFSQSTVKKFLVDMGHSVKVSKSFIMLNVHLTETVVQLKH